MAYPANRLLYTTSQAHLSTVWNPTEGKRKIALVNNEQL